MTVDWYANRHTLEEGQVFQTLDGLVKLDRRVPGDGTKWYVQNFSGGRWFCEDATIEPGDLLEKVSK